MKIQIVRYNNKLMLTLKDKGFICVIMSGKDTRELISISKEKYILFNRLKDGKNALVLNPRLMYAGNKREKLESIEKLMNNDD